MDIIKQRRINLRTAIDKAISSSNGSLSSDASFCEHYDLNPSHISQLVKGHGSFGERAARNLEKKIGWATGFLDQESSNKDIKKENDDNSFFKNVSVVKPRMAPVLSWVQAGNWTNSSAVELNDVVKWIPLPEHVCDKCYYLEVRGVSNYPMFQEGDFILVDPSVQYSDIQSGDIIVVRKDTDATFKKLVIEPDNSRYLQALNPEFKPNIIQIDESCMFIGQVIDCVRYVYTAPSRRKAH